MMRVGLAVANITPDRPLYLAGFGPDRLSEGTYHDLFATAAVFDNGATRVCLMALDILTVDESLVVPVTEAGARLGIAPEGMLLNTSHTHTGPVTERVRSPIRKFDEPYLDGLRERLCELVGEATADVRPATLDYVEGSSTMGVNRRVPFDGGCRPNGDRPIDPAVPVVRMLHPDGRVRGVIFSYACHPANNSGRLLGAEFPGFARDLVAESIPGCTPMFLQGCGGDVMARALDPMERTFRSASVAELAEFGHDVGRAVCAAFCGQPRPLGEALACASKTIELPFDHQPTEEELRAAEAGPAYQQRWARAAREALARCGSLIATLPLQIQAVRLGDLFVVASAAETCVETGLRLKAELPDLLTMPLGYTNGSWDYVGPGSVFTEGNYEGPLSHMDTVWPWPKPLGLRPDAEDLFVAESAALARSLS